jgi:hypothetical protein
VGIGICVEIGGVVGWEGRVTGWFAVRFGWFAVRGLLWICDGLKIAFLSSSDQISLLHIDQIVQLSRLPRAEKTVSGDHISGS